MLKEWARKFFPIIWYHLRTERQRKLGQRKWSNNSSAYGKQKQYLGLSNLSHWLVPYSSVTPIWWSNHYKIIRFSPCFLFLIPFSPFAIGLNAPEFFSYFWGEFRNSKHKSLVPAMTIQWESLMTLPGS